MKYKEIVEIYEKIESTTKRLEMTKYLVELLKKTPKEIIDKVIYLTPVSYTHLTLPTICSV